MLRKSSLATKSESFSLRPDFIAKSVSDIDFAYLKKLGITTIFLDLDGTVVGRGTFVVTDKVKNALKHSGLDIKIATNRPRSRSLKELKQDLHASSVMHPRGIYGKPTKHYFQSMLREFNLEPAEVVMIGDRIIQDILGANRSGIYSLLVHKLGPAVGAADRIVSDFEERFIRKHTPNYEEL